MGSTIVARSAPFVFRTCITKPARASPAHMSVLLPRSASHTRPFYTRAHNFTSPSHVISTTTTEITSPFPMEFMGRFPRMTMPTRKYPREIVFLGGAPGSGKGTNSLHIAELRGFDSPTIVVSDLLNTPLCKQLKDNGVMVDDEFVFNVLLKELEKPMYSNGVVVDGFPRTAKQAELLEDVYHQSHLPQNLAPNILFVMLHVDETTSINRQQARGREAMNLNEQRATLNLPLLDVRVTDTHIDASKSRYAVFKEQLNAVMRLGGQFPIAVVDASSPLDTVRENLTKQISMLPRDSLSLRI